MLAMKGGPGMNTGLWTTNSTLNPTDVQISTNAFAKYDVFNYFQATDWFASFPNSAVYGGDLPSTLYNGWSWIENNACNSTRTPLSAFLSGPYVKNSYGSTGYAATPIRPYDNGKFNMTMWYDGGALQASVYAINFESALKWGFKYNNTNNLTQTPTIQNIDKYPFRFFVR